MPTNQSKTNAERRPTTAEAKNKTAHPKGTPSALSPAVLAQRWDCCRQTVYNMIHDGQLHSFKVRNRRLIPLSEIERIENGAD